MTLQTVARQAPLSMGFSRQEYWSGLPCSLPGDLANPGIKPISCASPAVQADSLPTEATWEVLELVFSSDKYLGVELLDFMIVLMF